VKKKYIVCPSGRTKGESSPPAVFTAEGMGTGSYQSPETRIGGYGSEPGRTFTASGGMDEARVGVVAPFPSPPSKPPRAAAAKMAMIRTGKTQMSLDRAHLGGNLVEAIAENRSQKEIRLTFEMVEPAFYFKERILEPW